MVPIITNKKALRAFESLEARFNAVHNHFYSYVKAEFAGVHVPITITCPVHGDFIQEPNSHARGRKCPKCAKIAEGIARTCTTEKFITKCKSKYGNTYSYSSVQYTKAKAPVVITCVSHGDFSIRADHFLNGSGCPSCSIFGFNKQLPAILYYLSINNGQAYKIGITNKTVQIRFSLTDLYNIEIIKVWHYKLGEEAYAEEQRILTKYSSNKYVGDPLLQSGNTELFDCDILNLHKKDLHGVSIPNTTAISDERPNME